MPLIACPECQAQISDKAAACPRCGLPMTIGPVQEPNSDYQVPDGTVTAKRAGAPWEMAGTAMCVLGVILVVAGGAGAGALLLLAGFFVVVIGRFN